MKIDIQYYDCKDSQYHNIVIYGIQKAIKVIKNINDLHNVSSN